jgi:hypothetical protein
MTISGDRSECSTLPSLNRAKEILLLLLVPFASWRADDGAAAYFDAYRINRDTDVHCDPYTRLGEQIEISSF